MPQLNSQRYRDLEVSLSSHEANGRTTERSNLVYADCGFLAEPGAVPGEDNVVEGEQRAIVRRRFR